MNFEFNNRPLLKGRWKNKNRKLFSPPLPVNYIFFCVMLNKFFSYVIFILSCKFSSSSSLIIISSSAWDWFLRKNNDYLKRLIQLISYKRFLECTLAQWRLSIPKGTGSFFMKSPVLYYIFLSVEKKNLQIEPDAFKIWIYIFKLN